MVADHQPGRGHRRGAAAAHLAGAALADLEMVQLDSTAVVAPNGADGFLVTEAVRGEGAA